MADSNKKVIGASVLVVILTTLIVLGGVSIYDKNAYYCEGSHTVMTCDKLSTYYGLDNGKCYNKDVGNKLCRTGWLEIKNDIEITPDVIIPEETYSYQWLCSTKECIPK